MIGAANLDQTKFTRPLEFVLDRDAGVPALTFGGVLHLILWTKFDSKNKNSNQNFKISNRRREALLFGLPSYEDRDARDL